MDAGRDLGRVVHGLARQPRRHHGAALDPGPPARLPPGTAVDGQRLHAHLRRPAAHRGHPRRTVRPPPGVRHRPGPVHRRVGGRRTRAGHRLAHRRAGRAGRRGGHGRPADPDPAVGGGAPAAPRHGPGHLGCGRRPGHRYRPAGRRGRRRRRVVAVDLLAERADRHRAAAHRPDPAHREPRAGHRPGPARRGAGQPGSAGHRVRRRQRQLRTAGPAPPCWPPS